MKRGTEPDFPGNSPENQNAVSIVDTPLPPKLAEGVRKAVGRSAASATTKAYASDMRIFEAWCGRYGRTAFPASPETIAAFLVEEAAAGKKVATLERRLAAIAVGHATLKLVDTNAAQQGSPTGHPIVRQAMEGIRRESGTAQDRKRALTVADVRAICEMLPENLEGWMTKALLLIGFAGGFRRSELAAFDVRDVRIVEQGVLLFLRRSKTDQSGQGRWVAISQGVNPVTCPVRALKTWMLMGGLAEADPLFRHARWEWVLEGRITGHQINKIVKQAVKMIGLDASDYGAHSLRAGLVTAARAAGGQNWAVMRQTGHASERMLGIYDRPEDLFEGNVTKMLGL